MVVEKLEKAQGKRMLSILLAVVMVLSTASVCLVSAAAKRESNLVSAQGDEEAFEDTSLERSTTKYIPSTTTTTRTDSTTNVTRTTTTTTTTTVPNTTVHEHTWVSANCIRPKICSGCGLTSGTALGHNFDTDGYPIL